MDLLIDCGCERTAPRLLKPEKTSRVPSRDKQLNIWGGHYSLSDGADEKLRKFSDNENSTSSDWLQELTYNM